MRNKTEREDAKRREKDISSFGYASGELQLTPTFAYIAKHKKENGSNSIGIKKSKGERERKRSSKQVTDRIMFMYM